MAKSPRNGVASAGGVGSVRGESPFEMEVFFEVTPYTAEMILAQGLFQGGPGGAFAPPLGFGLYYYTLSTWKTKIHY